jgi:hypothetical protein
MPIVATLAFSHLPGPACAQPAGPAPLPRVSVWIGGHLAPAAGGGTVTSDYVPTFNYGTLTAGNLHQELTVDTGSAIGPDAGVEVFMTKSVGIQFGFSRRSAGVTGTNAPYRVSITYSAVMPPSTVSQEFTVSREVDWPDTDGQLRQTSWFAGLTARRQTPSGRLSVTGAAGARLLGLSGHLDSLEYKMFILGGHAVLFDREYGVRMAPDEGRWTWRPYLAGDVRLRVAGRVRLMAGGRATIGSSTTSVSTRVVKVFDSEWGDGDDVFDAVKAKLGTPTAVLAVPRWELFAGLVFVVK